jgi:hypothetical protein
MNERIRYIKRGPVLQSLRIYTEGVTRYIVEIDTQNKLVSLVNVDTQETKSVPCDKSLHKMKIQGKKLLEEIGIKFEKETRTPKPEVIVKLFVMLAIMLMSTGCAEGPKELGKQLGCIFKGTACDSGRDQDIASLNSRVTNLEKDMASVRQQAANLQNYSDSLQAQENTTNTLVAVLQSQITALQTNSSTNAAAIATLQSQVAGLQTQVTSLNNSRTTTNASITVLQQQAATTLAQLATLNGYEHIVSLIDPCGDTPNKFDEVFFRLSTGKIVASFSDAASGLNTRFSVLTDGVFGTTDGTNCGFVISNEGRTVTPSVEY